MNDVHDAQRLMELQRLPLDRKIQITQTRIIEFYQHYQGNVCISFSGGKDSTVLLHIARQLYPEIPAVFSNTGLEYPEIQRFVKSFDHVDIVTPAMNFSEVVSNYGYPLIGKEVAEAIHYARRIRSHSGNVERERERERKRRNARNSYPNELLSEPQDDPQRRLEKDIHTHTIAKRTEFHGTRPAKPHTRDPNSAETDPSKPG